MAAGEHTGLGLVLLPLQIGLRRDGRPVGRHGLDGRRGAVGPPRVDVRGPLCGGELLDQRMLRRQHHVGGAEQGVGPRGEDVDVAGVGGEQHLGAGRPADPVALHGLDLVRPIQHVQVVEQPVGVRGDAHHPLPQPLPEHREVAAIAAAVRRHFFVGQHRAKTGAPVHHRVGPVDQAVGVDQVGALANGQFRPRATGGHRACPTRTRRSGRRSGVPCRPPGRTTRCRSAGRSTASTCRSRRRWWRSCGARHGRDRGGPVGGGSSRCWPRCARGDACRSAPRTARRADRTRRSPRRATHCARSSGSTWRRRRWRCSRAGARRAGPRPTGTGTCPARTSCPRARCCRRWEPETRPGSAR